MGNEMTPFRERGKPLRGRGQSPPQLDALAFQEHNFTWEQVVRVLRKHARFSLLLATLLIGLTVTYALLQKDYYSPTARLEIAPPGTGFNALHEIDSTSPSENQDYLETQVQILRSDALAVSVIRELHLDRNPEFVSQSVLRQPARSAAEKMQSGPLAVLQDQIDLATLTAAEYAALEQFRRRLSVGTVRNTRLAEVSFSANDPTSAQLIANTLIAEFIDQNYKQRYTSTMQASGWLTSQLEDLRKKVEDSARAVAKYQKRYGLVELDERDVPMSQLMNDVNHQLSEAQANRIENEAYIRMVDDGHTDSIPALRDDKLYQDLMSHYVDLRTQLAQARTVYGDANVAVKKLQDQLLEVSTQIDAERKRVIARARSLYNAAREREELMMKEREQLLATVADKSSELTAFHFLKEEASANASLYNTLQGRLREAGIYAGLRSSNIRVVDMAGNLHKPTGPHRSFIVGLGTLAACLFAVVFSFARESLRNTVLTPDDVRSWTGLTSLALLPAMHVAPKTEGFAARHIPVIWREDSAFRDVQLMKTESAESEAIRELRTALLSARLASTPQVILISSSMEGEGKTTIAVNFAVALAKIGRTCLVDGDLRHPSVAGVFDVEARAPLTDVLNRKFPLASALIDAVSVPNLSILPCGTISGSPADILSSEDMTSLLDILRTEFAFVVIDSPPVIRFSDARFLSSVSDEVVIVGRYGVTTRRAIQRTAEILSEMQAPVAGVVLNGIDFSSPDYEYYTFGYTSGKNKREYRYSNSASRPDSDGKPPDAMSARA